MRDCRGLIVAALIGCGRTTPPPERAAPAATGAVTTVVPSETDARVAQVEEMLRGVPGLDVTRLPDGGYQLRIRGQRSIRGNPGDDDPLLVVDGIPISPGALGSTLASLAPEDIARIEVLKDAGAAGLFRVTGADGGDRIITERSH